MIQQIIDYIDSGKSIVIECTKRISNCESFLEVNMRGRIVSYQLQHDDIYKLTIDVSEFEDYNIPLMSNDYFDKEGNPILNAIEAGYYPVNKKEIIYIDKVDASDGGGYFNVITDCTLFNKWKNSKSDLSYVCWLEELAALSIQYETKIQFLVDKLQMML